VRQGLRLYTEALLRFPQHPGLVYGYAAALIDARRFADALRFVQDRLASRGDDVRLHKLRAQCHAGLGQVALQHQALAEAFALMGQTAAAIEQLQLAQRAADANFYDMSAIDARLRQMKLKRLEEVKESRN
jgi:predicted Zn-dependent protease